MGGSGNTIAPGFLSLWSSRAALGIYTYIQNPYYFPASTDDLMKISILSGQYCFSSDECTTLSLDCLGEAVWYQEEHQVKSPEF